MCYHRKKRFGLEWRVMMKKKVLSLLMSFAICFTVMPDTVYAAAPGGVAVSGNGGGQSETVLNASGSEGKESTASGSAQTKTTVSGNAPAENGSTAVQNAQTAGVQSMIDAMPPLEELQAADAQTQQEIYEALQEAYDAYEALSEEDKALIVGADCFESLFGWFNAQVSPLGEVTTHTHCICGLIHQDIGDHTTENVQTWTAITDTNSDGTITMTELQTQIASGGYFYLTADVVQENVEEKLIVNVSGVTAICLNGHEMKLNSWYSEGIYLNKNGNEATKLILTDCDSESKGAITFTPENSWDSMCAVGVQNGASFEMYGGSIKGMRRTQGGAGVRCTGYQSSFKMYGGSIQGNNNTYGYPSGDRGAAVYCGDNTSFTMYGGTITGSTHQNGSGGGVYCGANNTFTMLGGEISGNTAALNGGGVLVDGSMTIGGTARITGNTAGGKTGNLFLNGSNSVLNVRADFTGEVGLAAFDGVDRQIVSREEGSAGMITYDAAGYELGTDGKLTLNHVHAPGEETTDRCATCNGLLVASVTPQTGAASYYTKAEDAMEAVTPETTVKLLRDADYNGNLEITKPMTLDLNGKYFYTVEGDVFIRAADVKILGNASADAEGRLNRKTWSYDYSYYKESPAAVTIGSTDEAVSGGLTLSKQGVVGVVTVLNGTFTMTDGRIYGLVSYKKGDTKLFGGTISERGSGITIKGEGYTIKDLFAEERVLLAVKGGTSSPVTEEQLAGTTLTTLSETTSYKIAKPGFESVSISGGNQTVRYGETTTVTLTAVPVMAEGYNLADVSYQWEQDGKEVQDENTNSYVFEVSEFGSKAPVEGGTEPASYVITCTMTCGGYSQTAETTITVLPKEITAGTGNVTFGSGSESFTYTGSALTPAVTLKDGENTVSPTEYELNYSNNRNAGIATVTFTDKPGGKYTVTGSVSFTIGKAETPAQCEVTIEDFAYGSPATPGLSLAMENRAVTYYYSASNQTNTAQSTKWTEEAAKSQSVGTYYLFAVMEESENYFAYTTPTKAFQITQAEPVTTWPTVQDVYVGDTLDESYLGGAERKIPGAFTITGTKSWTESGTKTTTLAFTANPENANYITTTTKEVSVNVIKHLMTAADPGTTTIADKEFGTALGDLGLPATVTVIATAHNRTKSYDGIPVSWSSADYNPQTLEIQNLTGTLDISAYSEELEQPSTPITVKATVQLKERTLQLPALAAKTVTYNGAAQPHELTAADIPVGVRSVSYSYEGTNGTSYEKSATPPTGAGSYTVTASFTVDAGYKQPSDVTATLTIEKADLSAEAGMSAYTYGGTPSVPGIVGNTENGAVTYYYNTTDSNTGGTEWKDMTGTSLNAGSYYLYAVIAATDNYKSCTTQPVSFAVNQAVPAVTWPTVSGLYVGDTLAVSDLSGGSSPVAGGFSITGTASWNVSGEKTTELTFTPTDMNYKPVTNGNVAVSVIRRTVASVASQTAITGKLCYTALGELGLPEKVNITTGDGKMYENIPVTWSGYREEKPQPQTLTGTLDLSGIANEVEQPAQPVTAEIQVTLEKRTAPTPDLADKNVTYSGRQQGNAFDTMPVGVTAVEYEYEGKEGTEYAKSVTPPTNVGSYTVTASFTMREGYHQLASADATLDITPLSLEGAEVVLGERLEANGRAQTQTVTAVKAAGVSLSEADYTITGNTGTAAGVYTLTVSGRGNCIGEVKKAWNIYEEENDEQEEETVEETGGMSGSAGGWQEVNRTLQELGALTGGNRNAAAAGSTAAGNGAATRESRNVNVQMPGGGEVPAYVLETLRGTQLTLALQQGNGVTLSISGNGIGRNALAGQQTLELTTDTNANAIPETLIREKRSGVNRQLTIRDTGRFAVPVNLHVNMGAENAGRYANFYRYNAALGRLEYCGSFRIAENGQAMTALRQGGSYLVNVTDTRPVETGLFRGDSYTVKSGDTLGRIAAAYHMSVSELLRRNPGIADANKIRAGQRINVN